jgi:hypothetical protein
LDYYRVPKSKYNDLYFCPFHDDTSPSLVANNRRGVATCLSQHCVKGADIFGLIQKFESCDFNHAVRKAISLVGLEVNTHYKSHEIQNQGDRPQKDYSIVPRTFSLEERHVEFLKKRYGKRWEWVVETFGVKAWKYHIALPVSQDLTVFIPLRKQSKADPQGDRVFYRGKDRSVQVFPDWKEAHAKASKILVVEGEKDVMRVSAELKRHRRGDEWAVITNTMGAHNLKLETPLFKNFNPDLVEQVVICFDHDPAGHSANEIAKQSALNFFSKKTRVGVYRFPMERPRGYDISDYLDEEGNLFEMIWGSIS